MCFFKGEELALQLAVLVDCSGGRCWMGAARAKGCSFTSVAGGWAQCLHHMHTRSQFNASLQLVLCFHGSLASLHVVTAQLWRYG